MNTPVFYNPATPFETLLSNVQPGLTINVHGRRIPGDRFAIQFKTGPGPHADLAFRFCANWVHAQPEVLGNSRVGGKWGSGIIYVKGSSPFVMGQSFQVKIMIEQNGYKVAVNGTHFATFPHRVNLYSIKYLEVETAIAIDQVSIYNQGSCAAPSSSMTVQNPIIPYETGLGTIQLGMSFTVYGRPGGADRFAIQFKTGPGPNADLAFRFCAKWVNNKHEVIGNSRVHNQWGSHVIFMSGSSPFAMGLNFQVMVMIESDGFKVAVNGCHFATFPHRVNVYSLKYVEVEGGVAVDQIETAQHRVPYPPSYFQAAPLSIPSIPSVNQPILNPTKKQPIAIPLHNIRDHTVTVNGVPGQGRFSIQFINACNPSNIYFFFNPRLGQRVVARNSSYQSIWGAEETTISGGFPFSPGHPFQVEISVDRRCFTVSVDGVYLCEFNHRQRPLKQITHMKFAGNVNISSVSFR